MLDLLFLRVPDPTPARRSDDAHLPAVSDHSVMSVGLDATLPASNRATLDVRYAAAMANGGKDNGIPGLHDHPKSRSAFVIDPGGHHPKAVCHRWA